MLSIKNVVEDRGHSGKQGKVGSAPICDHTVRGEGMCEDPYLLLGARCSHRKTPSVEHSGRREAVPAEPLAVTTWAGILASDGVGCRWC